MSNHTSSSLGLADIGTGSTGGFGGFDLTGQQHFQHPLLGRQAAGPPGPLPNSGADASVHTVTSFYSHMSGNTTGAASSGAAHEGAPSSLFYHYPLCRGSVPPARWAHASAVVGGTIWVYGGVGNSVLDDLCALDADTLSWRVVSTHAARSKDRPEKMLGHAAAATGTKIWMFGGQQGRKFLRTLFCFDTDTCTWTRLPEADSQPAARAGHSMVTVHSSVVYLFGGQGKRLYNDLYKLDPATGSFSEVEVSGKPPAPRRGHSLTWDGRDYLVCFGGINQSSTDSALNVFSLSRGAWFTPQAFGPAPSARTQHTAQLLSPGIILIFGGCNSGGTFFNDAVVLDTRTFTWHKPALLNTAPAPRYHHTCNLVNGRIIVYGGINSKQTFDGVVVVETKFAADLANVAEELFRMSADAGGTASVAASILQTTSANAVAASPTAAAAGAAAAAAAAAAAVSSVTHLGALQIGPMHAPSRLMLATTPNGGMVTAVSVSRAAAPTGPSTVASTPTAAGQQHNTTPTLSSSAHPLLQVVPAPSAAPSELTNITSSKSLEAVKVQLTDLLLRRNQEEQLLQTAKKAETTESLLHKEREAREAATKEMLQYKLLLAEAEEAQASTQQQLQSILARATREAATVVELRGQVEQLQCKLASREEELQEARLLQDGLVKELGIMASRYSRLAMDVQDSSDRPDRNGGGGGGGAAAERGTPAGGAAHVISSSTRRTSLSSMLSHAQAQAGGSGAPGVAGARHSTVVCPGMSTGLLVSQTAEELQASGSYSVPLPEPSGNSMLAARGPFPTPALSTQCAGPQRARSGANAIAAAARAAVAAGSASSSNAQPQADAGAGGSALPFAPCGNCCQQLLGLLSDAEMHRAALLESNQSLSDKVDELTNQNSMLYVQLRQMLAEASALEPLALCEMEELERKLEASSRSVRDALILRKIDEAQRRSSNEQAACAVCMEGPKAVVFNCGHQSCEACSGKMSSCPFCRVAITARIRLFDA